MKHTEQFTEMDNSLLVAAPAKINLSLLVEGKRPDGFHNIETIMAKVNWYDKLLIEHRQKPGIEFITKGTRWSPQGRENIVYRTCRLLLDRYRPDAPVKMTLTKNIPAGTGLGSASSDAAAALLGLKRFLKLDIEEKDMSQMAANLGSDVAFFLAGPLAFCRGKGEKIQKNQKKFNFFALLIIPDVNVSTKMVYNNYKDNNDEYKRLKSRIDDFVCKNKIDLIVGMCANMLEKSCFHLFRELAELKRKIETLGVGPLCLSGSGSVMYCIVDDFDQARKYQCLIDREVGCESVIVSNNMW